MADKKKKAEKLDDSKKTKDTKETSSKAKSSDKKAAEKKPSVFSRIAKYFRECKSEVKKIVWPTTKTTFRNMGIVLAVLIVIGLLVFALDTGLIALLRLVMDI